MKGPKNKQESYDLYFAGKLGNHLQFWQTTDDYFSDIIMGRVSKDFPVALRTISTPGIQLPRYCVKSLYSDVLEIIELWTTQYNIKEYQITLNELANQEDITFQGEIKRSERYYDLTYTYVKKPMRSAFQDQMLHAHGLKVKQLIKRFMDDVSYDNLQDIFLQYPEVTIEFTCFNNAVGNLKWNTVFWEIREF